MRYDTKRKLQIALLATVCGIGGTGITLTPFHFINPADWDVSETICYQKGSIELYEYTPKSERHRFYLPADEGWVRVEDRQGVLVERFRGKCTTRTTLALMVDQRFKNFDNIEYLDDGT